MHGLLKCRNGDAGVKSNFSAVLWCLRHHNCPPKAAHPSQLHMLGLVATYANLILPLWSPLLPLLSVVSLCEHSKVKLSLRWLEEQRHQRHKMLSDAEDEMKIIKQPVRSNE